MKEVESTEYGGKSYLHTFCRIWAGERGEGGGKGGQGRRGAAGVLLGWAGGGFLQILSRRSHICLMYSTEYVPYACIFACMA